MSNSKTNTIMAKVTFSYSIGSGSIQSKQANVKVSHRSCITTYVEEEQCNWGDIYSEYLDFEITSQCWH